MNDSCKLINRMPGIYGIVRVSTVAVTVALWTITSITVPFLLLVMDIPSTQ